MDSILSITIRDPNHACAPYESSGHTFFVQIFNCDFRPLFWNGIDYGHPVPLNVKGAKGGNIHAQIRVPPGCYLVRGVASCYNVVTEWAWVEAACGEKVCVNLVPTTIRYCLDRVIIGFNLGTIAPIAPKGLAADSASPQMIAKSMPSEIKVAFDALKKITEKLPTDNLPLPPSLDEIQSVIDRQEKAEKKSST